MNTTESAQLLELYPAFHALHALQSMLGQLPVHEAPPGTPLFREQQACAGFPLVLTGEVRVSRASAQGRELELYRVLPGEMCLVSSASLFAQQPLSARGTTTAATRFCLLSPGDFQAALSQPDFRDFVLGLFAARMADLTALIEAVAFQRLDSRLASALLGHGAQLHVTHQALADELGTVREIVTRLLHRFERDGLIALSRECITICDSAGLRGVAALPTR
jgi:CRP/FNR family transcriptional regulator, anaerobic regulatory protein